MTWKITIGKYKLMMLDSCEIFRSVEALTDTATIVLPGTSYNKTLDVESQIKRGNVVKIEVGYDGFLMNEFTGFVESILTDDGSITVKCEDGLFLYRVALPNAELKNVSVSDVLEYVHKTVTEFTIDCNYSFKYDKFTIHNATAFDVLKKIQQETKANIYLKESTLHIHPQYSEVFGSAKYDFSRNIEKSDLKYRDAKDRKVLVVVETKGKDGKVIRQESGTIGGDRFTINISGVTDKASMKKLADESLATKVYTGYEGSFDGWLLPFCDAGYKAIIVDQEYEYKNGSYYVLDVKTFFSRQGGKRTVRIGKRLSDG